MPSISKRNRILKTAGEMFIKQGFAKVSMDAIAAAVPVSKPTLYNNFSDKKELFAAVIREKCNDLAEEVEANIREETDPETALRNIGTKFLNMLMAPGAVKMHRIMIAESIEFPEMAKLFYKTGPERIHMLLEKYLKKQNQLKNLKVENTKLSASMFLSGLKNYVHMECMLGLRATPTLEERKEVINYSIRLFLKSHL